MLRRSIAILLLAAGCFTRDAGEPRFFRPESALMSGAADEPAHATPATHAIAIRLRAVEGGPFLRERIVWRTSSVEYGLYEQRRWRELPATYVERALTTAFEDAPGVRLSDDSLAPALRVELVSFDEVLAPMHLALVQVAVSLRDKTGQRLLDQTFTAERPIEDADPATMARAMGHALDEVARQVSAVVGSFAKARK